ncbi:MAG TPA: helicase-related protein [Candidatus Nanoarchaeia archaeon]|nr:helicase-related protein [Candidatus Nanoarchaeia archaeon]
MTLIKLISDTLAMGKQALVFVNTKRGAEKAAEELAHSIRNVQLTELSAEILHALSKPTKQCERLARTIEKGIAFHHAGLVQKQRELIEDNFRTGDIKIICATPTLAMGVDLPAFRSILKDLKRYGHRGLEYIPVLEYMQMAGRAGRPKFDSYGEAICIATSEAQKDELIERYLKGDPEDIFSKLAVEPVLRMYVLSLLAAGFVRTKKQLFDFFSKTFFAHQFEDLGKINALIEKILQLLEEWEFITSSGSQDFTSALDLGNEHYKTSLMGKRVAELYIDPLTAHEFVLCLQKAASMKTTDFSFLQMVSSSLEMRPQLKMRVKESEEIQQELMKNEEFLLAGEPSLYDYEYDSFLDSIKTTLFFSEWIDEKDEEYLLERFNIRPGEIRVKLDIADWLLYTSEELVKILNFKPLIKDLSKLRIRIQNGVKEELIPLLKFEQVGRVRARILFRNGIKDVADVKKADFSTMVSLLGKNVAIIVKKQVGQDFAKIEVKENKRKGQISLRDY